jgi:NADH-quinone oxidoreductase subunit F
VRAGHPAISTQADLRRAAARGRRTFQPTQPKLIVGMATCGLAAGAEEVYQAIQEEVERLGLPYLIGSTGCIGWCSQEPLVDLQLPGRPRLTYGRMDVRKARELARGLPEDDFKVHWAVGQLMGYDNPVTGRRSTLATPAVRWDGVPRYEDLPMFRQQLRLVLRNCGLIDPSSVDEYICRGGYLALCHALGTMSPEQVIGQVTLSGLRGRGGAGFPTGKKWEMMNRQTATPKYIVCNADEGDPGAYMDRAVLEGDPHSVLEGMTLGAYAMGACEGIVYIREEYPLAVQRVTEAIAQAECAGLLGENILGFRADTDHRPGFSFRIRVVKGAGAFVCGEETALMRSVEGHVGEPRQRPPYPVQHGLWRKPTCINNVETWANIPVIVMRGGEWFSRIGTPSSKGTKVFSLVGAVNNTALIEVPMGIKLRQIVQEVGGGIPEGRRFKAIQTGGPSGGCLPASHLDLEVDYESLTAAGAIMGSGGMIVMDESNCMVDIAKYFLTFVTDESCGKCFSCRKGLERMKELVTGITEGHGTEQDLSLLEDLGWLVRETSLCGLGQTAPNPVLSTLRYFRQEYERHLWHKRCDAFVCKELVGAPCQSACPLGTEAWRYVAHLARGEYEQAYRVIRETNPFPSVCARVCDHPCEERCRLTATGCRPVAIRALKRFVTDRVDPTACKPVRVARSGMETATVAVVGSGPAGLAAAHYLSLDGYRVTVFEADHEPGGMLISGIPAYRLRRDVLRKEIASLVDENVTVRCDSALGRDFTIDDLFAKGYKAVFLALGAHKSTRLNVEGEDLNGVYPAIQFLKAFNLQAKKLAKGRVGIIGGGNSAVDAGRVALRQEAVESVTIFYRRTRPDMPALTEEVDSALQEGLRLETLVSPTRILSRNDRLSGLECVRNELGELDSSGRRHPVPVPGTEFSVPLDTLIVTIGDEPDIDYISSMGIEVTEKGRLRVDTETLATRRPGVFAGGDAVTGPNTVVEAIAAGKKAAVTIARYLRGEQMRQPSAPGTPRVYVQPCVLPEEELSDIRRAEPPTLPIELRKRSFSEVELSLSQQDATREARRCLRCDLEFTEPKENRTAPRVTGAKPV